MRAETLAVRVIAEGGKEKPGEVICQHWETSERAIRALKVLAICWGIAIPTILIPGLHFVLPPMFFLGGIIGAYFRWRETALILGDNLNCPACAAKNSLLASKPEWPIFQKCSSCEAYLRVEKK